MWSPPHVLLALMFIAAWLLVIRLLREHETNVEARKLLSLFSLGLLNVNIWFLLLPFSPFSHYHLLGPYGFILTLPLFISLVIYSKHAFGFAAASLFSLFSLLPILFSFAESATAYAPLLPVWLKITPVLLAALSLDIIPADTKFFAQDRKSVV